MYKDKLLNFINENTNFEIEKDGNYLLTEAFYISDKKHPKDKRKLMIRSISDGISHVGLRTAKLKSVSTDSMKGKSKTQGVPITFKSRKISDNKEVWEWDIALKDKKEKMETLAGLSKEDKKFLDNIITKGGEDFAEYWELTPKDDNDKMKEIEKKYTK